MERSPASGPSVPPPGGGNGTGTGTGTGTGGTAQTDNGSAYLSSSPFMSASSSSGGMTGSIPMSNSTSTSTTAPTAASKPSLSQQLLRTFRPRSQAATAAPPFVTSATVSPMIRAENGTLANATPSTSTAAFSGTTATTNTMQQQDMRDVASLTLADFQSMLNDLRKPILSLPALEDRQALMQNQVGCVRTLISAIKLATDAEEADAEEQENVKWTSDQMLQPGPPQAEVFKVCLWLLTQAKEGQLPLPLGLAACELVTASVRLSDLRAAKATKAARETRSGAPGSQSAKAPDADHPLANIDRAAIYALVCHLTDHADVPNVLPNKENKYQTRLPALPVQLKAIERLSLEGRDVTSFPGILEFLGDALQTVWQEMQALRRLIVKEVIPATSSSDEPRSPTSSSVEEQAIIVEQLTLREWSVLSCLQLITSIVKFSFAKLDLGSIEDVLARVSFMLLNAYPGEVRNSTLPSRDVRRTRRSKSRERRPLADGYDYYGLDVLNINSNTPSASDTPRGILTPRLGPRNPDTSTTVAPIALATVPPVSAVAAAGTALKEDDEQLIVQESEVRAALKLVDSVLRFGFMPPRSVEGVTKILCRILGHNIATPAPGIDWTALATPVLANLLRSHCANASLRYARRMLVDVGVAEDVTLICGAVEFLKCALSIEAESERANTEDALSPILSVPLLMPALSGALRRHVDVLDNQVLHLVSEMLPLKEGRHLLGQRLTPDDWDMLLDLPAIAKRHLLDYNWDDANHSQNTATPAVIEAMLRLVDRLRLANVNEVDEGKDNPDELPWTPKLAALLLSLSPFLSDGLVIDLVQYYKARHLCLPCTSEWIENVRSLLHALFHRTTSRRQLSITSDGRNNGSAARQVLVDFLLNHVYGTVQDLPKHRSALLLRVIIPLAQVALATETDVKVEETIRRTLIEAAVTAASTTGAASEENDGEEHQKVDDGIFRDVIDLHYNLARSSASASFAGYAAKTKSARVPSHGSLPHVSFVDPPGSHEHKPKSGHVRQASAPEGMETDDANANVRSKAVQSTLDLIAIFHKLAFSSPWVLLPTSRSVQQSEKVQRLAWERRARTACLTIFSVLLDLVKYTDGAANNGEREGGEDAASATGAASFAPTTSTAVRLTILQWLVRLRTDSEHRIYIAGDLNELILPAATTLGRGPDSQNQTTFDMQQPLPSNVSAEDRLRTRRDTIGSAGTTAGAREGGRERELARQRTPAERSASRIRDASRDRGRRRDDLSGTNDSRDTSRLRSPSRTPAQQRKPAAFVHPLWRLPEKLPFEVPPPGWRSDVVFTYMHPITDATAHHHHHHRYAADNDDNSPPVPLPISSYVATCIAILANDREWDLVSYLLCHLPHQLANKHLVCGPKAQTEILLLRQLLTTTIFEQKFVNQIALPDDVKRSDVYAVAYGTLTTLISYRALLSRSQQDELVEAFMAGLNKSSNTAQPCIRALTVACFELQKSINRHLPKMLVKLSTVMSSSTMSVHILEMIAAIGTLPSLYANFTETDYRRIFGIALQYIQYHNQRSAEEDARSSATTFTLSQYVIMLAYYNISLWFLIVKIGDRPKYVESIRKGLLLANEGRAQVADQTEVCFDFLARYAYSNAEPRPQESFLNKLVKAKSAAGVRNAGGAAGGGGGGKQEALSKHFLYGKGLLTVTSLDKAGWAEIIVRRPSGTVGLLCKLENVPVSRLPDEDGERVDLPAALMMDRKMPPTSNIAQTASQHAQLAAWVRQQLDERERNTAIPSGPTSLFSLTPHRPRAQSEPDVGRHHDALRKANKAAVDAYTLGDESTVDDEGELLTPESQELKAAMSRVLSENASSVRDADASATDSGGEANVKARQSSVARNEHAVEPGFLALQLSAYPDINPSSKPPLLLPNEAWVQRMVRAVDLTPTVDFHRIGILYVGAGQTHEREILGNRTGSTRYANFLRGMGDLIVLRGQQNVYTGGLDTHNDEHGKYAYVWGDDICQIVFHTTTLMPNDEVHDPNHARKKALIGNDWVRIVWNEAGREYDFDTIKTQFNYINIIVSPNSRGGGELGSISAADTLFYRVSLQCIEGLPNFAPIGDGQLVSAAALPSFVRILALNCSLVSQIFASTDGRQGAQATAYTYTSNWVSRLHHIERAKAKMLASTASANGGGESDAPLTISAAANSSVADAGGSANPGSAMAATDGDTAADGSATAKGSAQTDKLSTTKLISASDPTAYDILRF